MIGISTIKKVRLMSGFLFFMVFFTGCSREENLITITGETMGTTYSVKIRPGDDFSETAENLKLEIDSLLTALNQQVSTYIPSSEISRFNDSISVQPFRISDEFYKIMQEAVEISRLSGGAFDVTVHPLVRLWGFGKDGRRWEPPKTAAVDSLLRLTGIRLLKLDDHQIRKEIPELEIDLSAIAKGYGVDLIARYLKTKGLKDFMVEIGGEVNCSGTKADEPWQIGIEKPEYFPGKERELEAVVTLTNRSLATSGNYRNYFVFEGKRYAHTIDPATGYPVEHGVVSASVIAPSCMRADALATAMMVMGVEKSLTLAESLKEVDCMLITRDEEGRYKAHYSSGFGKYMKK